MVTPTYCAVLGCETNSKQKNARFFKIPKVSKKFGDLGKLWREFTRRKNTTINSWRFCSLHFPPELCKPGPKGRLRLKNGSVPTIYYKNGQKIVVPYNQDYQKYYGPEAEILYEEADKANVDHEKELLNLRYKKLCDLKNLCRFCFSSSRDSKCIDMSALANYSVDPEVMLFALTGATPYNCVFSEIICEPCFLKVIDLHNFRKKCSERQREQIAELDQLDRKILNVQKSKRTELCPWYQVQLGQEPDDFENSMILNSNVNNSLPFEQTETNTQSENEICEVMVKQEPSLSAEEFDDDFNDESEMFHDVPTHFDDSSDDDNVLSNLLVPLKAESQNGEVSDKKRGKREVKRKPKKFKKSNQKSSKVEMKTNDATKTQESNKDVKQVQVNDSKKKQEGLKDVTFECFFCRGKFLGKSTLKKHNCQVKFRECEVAECGKKFPNQGTYANHLNRVHGRPKICKHYCPGCRTYYQMNIFQFQDHIKSCVHNKEVAQEPIKCEFCDKICDNLEVYTAHKLFHATEKLIENVDENGVKTYQKPKVTTEKKSICDVCGKVMSNHKNLREHKQNVHLVNFTGELFSCDLCPVKKPTRKLIYNHIKSVHVIQWHECGTCGKDFKSKRLLARHVLFMHERHRLKIRCFICPDRPGFNAKIYLEQHMRKHHGESSAKMVKRYRCDYGFCEVSYSNQKTLDQHKMKAHGYYF